MSGYGRFKSGIFHHPAVDNNRYMPSAFNQIFDIDGFEFLRIQGCDKDDVFCHGLYLPITKLVLLELISKIVDHAKYSWLEATPTSQYQQWERHLAAKCDYFESVCTKLLAALDAFLR
jgi:hypothetical protein